MLLQPQGLRGHFAAVCLHAFGCMAESRESNSRGAQCSGPSQLAEFWKSKRQAAANIVAYEGIGQVQFQPCGFQSRPKLARFKKKEDDFCYPSTSASLELRGLALRGLLGTRRGISCGDSLSCKRGRAKTNKPCLLQTRLLHLLFMPQPLGMARCTRDAKRGCEG